MFSLTMAIGLKLTRQLSTAMQQKFVGPLHSMPRKCTQTVSLARNMPVAPETGELTMRDLADDWRKWSFPERLLAVALMLMLIGLPLRALIAATPL